MHHLVHEDGRLDFDVDDARVPEVLRALADLGVQNLTVTPPSLEELLLRHYGDRQARAALLDTPSAVLMTGPAFGADDCTLAP